MISKVIVANIKLYTCGDFYEPYGIAAINFLSLAAENKRRIFLVKCFVGLFAN